MAKIYITEFQGAPPVSVSFQAPHQPPVASQTVAISGGTTQSNPFNTATGLIRVNVDVAALVEIGANPNATTTSMRMPADATEYFVVNPGDKLAVLSAG